MSAVLDGDGDEGRPPTENEREKREALQHLLAANGIREDDLKYPERVTTIEMVLDEYCSMKGLRHFTNLRMVCMIQQAVCRIEGLETCVHLEKLLLNENEIMKVENLSACTRLKHLNLSSNRIKELGQGLYGLGDLQVLWIAENNLTSLAGIEMAPALTDLNAARNSITTVQGALQRNQKLRILNLADNTICSFRDVLELSRLPALTELNFSDPDWGENPIGLLCNYQTYILYHLPLLTVLDRYRVPKEDHQAAEALFARKRLFYNTRAKLLRRQCADGIRFARAVHEDRVMAIRSELEVATKTLKRLDAVAQARQMNPEEALVAEGGDDDEKARQVAEQKLQACQAELEDQAIFIEDVCEQLRHERDAFLKSLQTELESGGNVRLESVAPEKEPWAKQVEDLVRARFRAMEFDHYGIDDIKVQSITRVYNESLRARFEDNIEKMGIDQNTRELEYLFYVPEPGSAPSDLRTVAEEGPGGSAGAGARRKSPDAAPSTAAAPGAGEGDPLDASSSAAAEGGGDLVAPLYSSTAGSKLEEMAAEPPEPPTLLTNSVSLAELARLEAYGATTPGQAASRAMRRAMARQRAGSSAGGILQIAGLDGSSSRVGRAPVVCSGTLLLCGACLGDCRMDDPSTFDAASDPNLWTLWRREPSHPKAAPAPLAAGAGLGGSLASASTGLATAGDDAPADAWYRSRSGDPKQKVWRVPNADMVLPQFIVEFDYVYRSEFVQSQLEARRIEQHGPFAALLRDYAFAAKVASPPAAALADEAATRSRLQTPAATADADDEVIAAAVAVAASLEEDEASGPPEIERLDGKILVDPSRKIIGAVEHDTLANIRVLNLHGRGIRKIDASALSVLTSLQMLLLSFNCIASLSSMPDCNTLTVLDVSFNYVEKVSSFMGIPSLTQLDLSWNALGLSLEVRELDASLRDFFAVLARDVPSVEVLELTGNPLTRSDWYRTVALTKMASLRTLDGLDVPDGEAAGAKEKVGRFDGVELTEAMLLEKSYLQAGGSAASTTTPSASGARRSRLPPLDLGDAPESFGAPAGAALMAAGAASGSRALVVPGLTRQNWRGFPEIADLRGLGLTDVTGGGGFHGFKSLRRLRLDGNKLTTLEALVPCVSLEELSVEHNFLPSLAGVGALAELRRLDAGCNKIADVLELRKLGKLGHLSLDDNLVDSLDTFAHLASLMELYVSNNLIEEVRSILLLKQLPRLLVLDLSGNELCVALDCRLYVMFHLRRLKVLDGRPITQEEHREAEDKFSGRITMELLEDKLGPAPSCYSFRSVDLSSQNIKEIGSLINDDIFPSLRELNLEGNPIADIRTMGPLSKLLVLKVNRTKIDLEKGMLADGEGQGGIAFLPHLQVLELGFCGIYDMSHFANFPMQTLRILHLPGNDITKVDGLSHMEQLRELVLDKNKVKQVDEHAFEGLRSLRELRMDDNGLKSLSNFGPLPRLRALHLSLNRVAELNELEKLRGLRHVVIVNLAQNPVSRKPLYRAHVINAVGSVRAIDGREVTDDERERTEQLLQGGSGQPPPGAGIYVFTESAAAQAQPLGQGLSYAVPTNLGGGNDGPAPGKSREEAAARRASYNSGGPSDRGGGPTQSHILMTGLGIGGEAPAEIPRGGPRSRR